jgi:hypothetical protein
LRALAWHQYLFKFIPSSAFACALIAHPHFLPVCYNLIALLFIPQIAHLLNMVLGSVVVVVVVVADIHLARMALPPDIPTIF